MPVHHSIRAPGDIGNRSRASRRATTRGWASCCTALASNKATLISPVRARVRAMPWPFSHRHEGIHRNAKSPPDPQAISGDRRMRSFRNADSAARVTHEPGRRPFIESPEASMTSRSMDLSGWTGFSYGCRVPNSCPLPAATLLVEVRDPHPVMVDPECERRFAVTGRLTGVPAVAGRPLRARQPGTVRSSSSRSSSPTGRRRCARVSPRPQAARQRHRPPG